MAECLDTFTNQERDGLSKTQALVAGNIFCHLQNIVFYFKSCSHLRIITSQCQFRIRTKKFLWKEGIPDLNKSLPLKILLVGGSKIRDSMVTQSLG